MTLQVQPPVNAADLLPAWTVDIPSFGGGFLIGFIIALILAFIFNYPKKLFNKEYQEDLLDNHAIRNPELGGYR